MAARIVTCVSLLASATLDDLSQILFVGGQAAMQAGCGCRLHLPDKIA